MAFSLNAASISLGKSAATNKTIKQSSTNKAQSSSESKSNQDSQESFLVNSETAGPSKAVSGSQEAVIGAELSRFQAAIKTGNLGRDFSEGLADPAPFVAQSQQQQAMGGAQGGGGGQSGLDSIAQNWSDKGAKENNDGDEKENNNNDNNNKRKNRDVS